MLHSSAAQNCDAAPGWSSRKIVSRDRAPMPSPHGGRRGHSLVTHFSDLTVSDLHRSDAPTFEIPKITGISGGFGSHRHQCAPVPSEFESHPGHHEGWATPEDARTRWSARHREVARERRSPTSSARVPTIQVASAASSKRDSPRTTWSHITSVSARASLS